MPGQNDHKSVLERYRLIRTSDHAEARNRLERVLGPHQLVLSGGSLENLCLHVCQFGSVLLSYVSLGASAQIELADARSSYLVQLPLGGHAQVRLRDERVLAIRQIGAVISPYDPASVQYSADCRQLIITLDRRSLEAHTRSLVHSRLSEPLRFELAMNFAAGRARDWHESLKSMVELADKHDGLLDHPSVVADMERSLMTGLLIAQPNTYSSQLHSQATGEERSPAGQAILLIKTYPERDHTVASLAESVGVSVRTLEKEFQRRVGIPPNAYLRDVRLERVREELIATAGETKRISAVASRWGLHHFGRFARAYYLKYHEKPSETLQRVRRNEPRPSAGSSK